MKFGFLHPDQKEIPPEVAMPEALESGLGCPGEFLCIREQGGAVGCPEKSRDGEVSVSEQKKTEIGEGIE